MDGLMNNIFICEEFHGRPLSEWVNLVHKDFSIQSGWSYAPLKAGMFGWDNMAMSVGYVFRTAGLPLKNMTAERVAELVHDGWVANYTYWRDHKPYKPVYTPPAKPLGDDRRNLCASTTFKDLPQDEKDKDLMIARYLLKSIL
jgi:hypothetical protein